MTSLIYIADPMCSWCYGFGPELSALLDGLPGLPIEVIVGGLRAYNTQAVDDNLRNTLLDNWTRVQEKTGLSLNAHHLLQTGFIYDTEPACRAVVAARSLAPHATLAVFNAIQQAFYGEGQDVTRTEVLTSIASKVLEQSGLPIDQPTFQAVFDAESSRAATRADFMQVKHWEVNGFPTLVLDRDGQLDLITAGYMKMPALVEHMQDIVDQGTEQATHQSDI